MQLPILATLVAAVGAGQIQVGDDSSDSTVDVKVIELELPQIDQTEPPTTEEPTSPPMTAIPEKHRPLHKKRHRHIQIYRPRKEGARAPAKKRTKTATNGWISLGNYNYKKFWNAKDNYDAENRCKREGAHLVSIHNELENQFVHSLMSTGQNIRSFEDFVYIGLRMDARTGEWYWTDGSKVDYKQWAVHQPDEPKTERCAQLHQDPGPGLKYVEDYKWNSISCNRPMKFFVCKK